MSNDKEDLEVFIASLLLQFYGNLLKVSRVRGMTMSLPMIRKFIRDSEETRNMYAEMLHDEIVGMGLQSNMQLRSLCEAQQEELAAGSAKNNTIHAEEIKKIIEKGEADRKEGDAVVIGSQGFSQERVEGFIRDPINFRLEDLSTADCSEVRRQLISSFERFAKWSFHLRMGFPFQGQDFHSLIFKVCQEVVDGKRDRLIVTIP